MPARIRPAAQIKEIVSGKHRFHFYPQPSGLPLLLQTTIERVHFFRLSNSGGPDQTRRTLRFAFSKGSVIAGDEPESVTRMSRSLV